MKSKANIYVFLLIAVLGILGYCNTFGVPFHYDGISVILKSHKLKTPGGILGSVLEFNKGITNLSFGLNYLWSGSSVFTYHLFNLLLHILNGFLLFVFVKNTLALKRCGTWFRENSFRIALLSSIIFTVHPVNTEAVTYIYQRSTLLVFFFYLLSLIAYRRFRTNPDKKFPLAVIVTGVFALMSKANAAMLPLALLLYEVYFFSKIKIKKKHVLILVIILIFLAVFPFMIGDSLFSKWKRTYEARTFTPVQRVLTQPRVLVYYLSIVFYPDSSRLTVSYDFEASTGILTPPSTLFAFFFLFVLFCLALYLSKRARVIPFFILWFFIHNAIESSFVPLMMAFEHRLYLPVVGVIVPVIAGFVYLQDCLDTGGNESWEDRLLSPMNLIFFLIVCLLVFWTLHRNTVWQTQERLWRDAVEKSPGSAQAHTMMGVVYYNKGDYERAIEENKKSIELNPNNSLPRANLAKSYIMTGNIKQAQKQVNEARRLNRKSAQVIQAYALLLAKREKYQKAISEFIKLKKKLGGFNYSLAVNLGYCHMKSGDLSQAENYLRKAIEINPANPKAHENLGKILKRRGKNREAARQFRLSAQSDRKSGSSSLR